jgi:hypothetical protein
MTGGDIRAPAPNDLGEKEEAPANGGAGRGFGFLDGGTLDGEGLPSRG